MQTEYREGNVPELLARHVTTIAPDGQRVLQHQKLPLSPKQGIWKIGASYENERVPDGLDVGPVWKGKVTAVECREAVPPRGPAGPSF